MRECIVVVIDNCKDKEIRITNRWKGLQDATDEFNRESCDVKIDLVRIKYDEMKHGVNLQAMCESCGTILSGSSYPLNNYNIDPTVQSMFGDEIALVKNTDKPLLGICFGHQLIGIAHDFKVDYCRDEEDGIYILDIDKHFDLLPSNIHCIFVEMRHKKEIVYEPRVEIDFDIVSQNNNCKIQILQHKKKKIYGVQFHVESDDEIVSDEGKIMLKNFFRICIENKAVRKSK